MTEKSSKIAKTTEEREQQMIRILSKMMLLKKIGEEISSSPCVSKQDSQYSFQSHQAHHQ